MSIHVALEKKSNKSIRVLQIVYIMEFLLFQCL